MRPSLDAWMLELASVVAKRSTCLRRAVGCVLVDSYGHILSTGYNGVAAGTPHCNEPTGPAKVGPEVDGHLSYGHSCPGASSSSGTNLDGCDAIHAEQNALLQCRDVQAIEACYVTVSPCLTCTKLLMNTSCRRIVFLEIYAASHGAAGEKWVSSGWPLERKWELWAGGRQAHSSDSIAGDRSI